MRFQSFFIPLLYPKGEHRICNGVGDEHVVEGDVEPVEELIYFCIPSEGVMKHKKFPPCRYGLGSLIPDDLANFK